MNKLNIIAFTALLFILISCDQPSELSDEDFGYKRHPVTGQILYFGSPYSGYVKEESQRKMFLIEGEFKDGFPHHGKIITYECGWEGKTYLKKKSSEFFLENGIKEGEYISYYWNGNLASQGNYKNDKKHGYWIENGEGGQPTNKGNYKNDKKHGDWIEGNNRYSYYEGKKDGTHIENTGKLKMIGQHVKGKREGDWFIINEARDTITKYGSFKKGKRNGLFKEYKPNYYENLVRSKQNNKLYLKKVRFYEDTGHERYASERYFGNRSTGVPYGLDVTWNEYYEISELFFATQINGLIYYGGFGGKLTSLIEKDTADQKPTKFHHLLNDNKGFVYSIYYELEKGEYTYSDAKDPLLHQDLYRHFIEKSENCFSGVRNSSIEKKIYSKSFIEESRDEILSFAKDMFGLNEDFILKLDE